MKRVLRAVLTLSGLCLLNGCGGSSGSSTPPPLVATPFSVNAPATAIAGRGINITVTALDASNNTVTSYSGTVHFTSTDGQAALPADSTLTNGTGTFSATLETVGGKRFTAPDTVTVWIAGTSNSIEFSAPGRVFTETGS